jgi:prepilin-type N-terminal cleavage/methylation domain-containing protein
MESFTHQNFSKKNLGGFTLIEILIVISLISILIFFLVSIGLNFYKSQQLESQAQTILQILRRAQLKAMAIEFDSSFGVYLTNSNYTLYKGSSYATRDLQYDEVFELPEIINVKGLSEVVFSKSEGKPNITGNIILTADSQQKIININEIGRINLQ